MRIFEVGDRLTNTEKQFICHNIIARTDIPRIIEEGNYNVSPKTIESVLSTIRVSHKSVGALNNLQKLAEENRKKV